MEMWEQSRGQDYLWDGLRDGVSGVMVSLLTLCGDVILPVCGVLVVHVEVSGEEGSLDDRSSSKYSENEWLTYSTLWPFMTFHTTFYKRTNNLIMSFNIMEQISSNWNWHYIHFFCVNSLSGLYWTSMVMLSPHCLNTFAASWYVAFLMLMPQT